MEWILFYENTRPFPVLIVDTRTTRVL